jgi:beta-N-acetylhexosaminidase
MVDIAGMELDAEEREILRHPLVGGAILFSRNYESPEQVARLIVDIHGLREPRLLVAVDQEGGRVQRFREGFTRLPAVRKLGEVYDRDRKRAKHFAEMTGWLMASELRAVGVDISFAPVLDLDRGISGVIGDRAFHADPEAIADLAHAYMIGMRRAGMAATGKHFPGHGTVEADSHVAIPIDSRPYADIYAEDIVPFERMIHYGMAAVMAAHVVYPEVDSQPAGFSSRWLGEVLRDELAFQGVVFSDDLSMVAAESAGDYVDRARTALLAGCDMVLVCNNPDGRNQVLDGLSDLDNPVSHLRLARMHGKHGMSRDALRASDHWKEAVRIVEEYDPEPLLDMDM